VVNLVTGRVGRLTAADRVPAMGALRPWHLFVCLLVIISIIGLLVTAIRRR
jgi:hypothetical protein